MIKTRNIADNAVTAAKLGADVTSLSTPDDSTVELNGDTLRVKDAGITRAKLAQVNAFHDIERSFVGADGAVLAVSETAGDFFRDIGTNQWLIRGEATINETEVSVGFASFVLPDNYVDGEAITLRAVCDVVLAGDAALTSAEVDCEAFLQTDATGAIGSDLCETAAISVTTTGAAKDFVITPTGLVAGNKLIFKITGTVVETAAGTGAAHMLITKIGVICAVRA